MPLASDMRQRVQDAIDRGRSNADDVFDETIEEIGALADAKGRVYDFKKGGPPPVIAEVLERLRLEGFGVQEVGNFHRVNW